MSVIPGLPDHVEPRTIYVLTFDFVRSTKNYHLYAQKDGINKLYLPIVDDKQPAERINAKVG